MHLLQFLTALDLKKSLKKKDKKRNLIKELPTPPKLGFFYFFFSLLNFPDQFSLSEISITVAVKLWNTGSRPKVNSSPISPSWGSVFTPWLTRAGSTVSTEYESWLRALFSSLSPKLLRSSPLSHPVIVNFASDPLINSAANESIPLKACVEERLERFRALPRLRAAEESLERWRMSQPCRGITWPPAAVESSSSETCIISGAPRSTASTAAWHRGQWPEHISPTEPFTGLMILPQASYKSDLKISGQTNRIRKPSSIHQLNWIQFASRLFSHIPGRRWAGPELMRLMRPARP